MGTLIHLVFKQKLSISLRDAYLLRNQPNSYFRKLFFCRRADLLQTKTELIEREIFRQLRVKLKIFLHDVSR